METTKTHNDSTSHMLLTGTILFANLDYNGLLDYAIKAILGGGIWMVFKLGSDYFSGKIRKKQKDGNR
ncbi:MAG TPA: hypothetical protein PK637_13300 [Flavobacteriales bacterium]|nr:hypothetical protein [Flavobacteriales bacterium]HRJ35920.1 hypothetical protein [Flavobacteriales bacterium]HRJ39369.1 hypothetical protein [Flavobacteriales bacterium]